MSNVFKSATASPSTPYISLSPFITGTDVNSGYSTIQAAINAAVSSGATTATPMNVYIKPKADGTNYVEDLNLASGVNIVGFGTVQYPTVTIQGKASFSSAGTVCISKIRFQTNSDYALSVTGSSASLVNIANCFFNCTNHTGISYSTSSPSAALKLFDCQGDLGTTGISLFTSTSASGLNMEYCTFLNSANSSTPSTSSAAPVSIQWSTLAFPISTTGTATYGIFNSAIDTSATNSVALTTSGTGSTNVQNSSFSSGTASSISIGAGSAVTVDNIEINSTNSNVITGTGILQYSEIAFSASGSNINTTTKILQPVAIGNLNLGSPLLIPSGGTGASTFTQANGIVTYVGSKLTNYPGPQLNSSGVFTNTSQPCFFVYLASTISNLTGDGTVAPVLFDTKSYDQASNITLNSSGKTIFTAPVTGKYLFVFNCTFSQVTSSYTNMQLRIVTTNQTLIMGNYNPGVVQSGSNFQTVFTTFAAMTAGDTAYCAVYMAGSTKSIALGGGSLSTPINWWNGSLLC